MAGEKMFSDLNRIVEIVGKEKGIDKQIVIDAVTQGLLMAARKKWGTYRDIEAQFNEESGEIELYQFLEVIEDENFVDEEIEIKFSEALELDPESQLHDSVGIRLEVDDLGRIAAQTAKQIITQKVRDAEREIIFSEFEERKGEIASGIARRIERGAIVVDLGRTEAFIPAREQIPGESYKPGDRIQGYISDVRQTTRGPQIIMSRADNRYLIKLFEMEVPEIYEGIVQIVAAAREPGHRAKIAVYSKESSVDPVGACVGMKGSRVQNIVQELKGEKIDIVNWDEDPARFVCNALAPAEISKVFVDEGNHEMEVVVPDHQLSLAIGRKGQNVRLAARLTEWRLDILSESNSAANTAEAISNLMLLADMTETIAQSIYQSGFESFQTIAVSKIEEVMSVPAYETEEAAQGLIDLASALVAKYEEEGIEIPVARKASVDKTPGTMGGGSGRKAKSDAESLLQKELEALNNATDETDSDEDEAVAAEGEVEATTKEATEASAEEAESEISEPTSDEEKNAEQDEKKEENGESSDSTE